MPDWKLLPWRKTPWTVPSFWNPIRIWLHGETMPSPRGAQPKGVPGIHYRREIPLGKGRALISTMCTDKADTDPIAAKLKNKLLTRYETCR